MAPTPGSRTWIHFFGSKKLNFSILNVVKCLLVMEKKEQSKMEEQGRGGGSWKVQKTEKKHHNHTIMRGGRTHNAGGDRKKVVSVWNRLRN